VLIKNQQDLEDIKASATTIVSRIPGIHAVSMPHEYTSDIFYGFSLHCEFMKALSSWNNVEKTLSHIRGVKHVWNSLSYRERSIGNHEFAPESSGQPALSGNLKATINSVHNLTQVTDLQLMSLSGKGVTVAFVDGCLDYMHPALGAGYGQGFRVQYGYDFVGDNVRPPNVAVPDEDPYGDCANHATHTAGILYGDDVSTGFRGVAPGVSIEHYRVFDCNGMSTSDVVVQAVLKAVERKVDLINLSLGSGSGPFYDG
jgi:subtilisin family serine protease